MPRRSASSPRFSPRSATSSASRSTTLPCIYAPAGERRSSRRSSTASSPRSRALFEGEGGLQARVDSVDFAGRRDRHEQAALRVVLDEGCGLTLEHLEAVANRVFVVVFALQQLAAGFLARVELRRRREVDVQHRAGLRARAPARQALHENLEVDVHQHDVVELELERAEQHVEAVGLARVARESVEDEAALRVGRCDTTLDHAEHDLVRDELAGVHDFLGSQAERRLVGDGLAQQVARRDLREPVVFLNALRLRAFAGTRRAAHDDSHWMSSTGWFERVTLANGRDSRQTFAILQSSRNAGGPVKKKNVFYAQSGGVTAVINASACGVIETARKHKSKLGRVYAGRNGIL